MRKAIVLRRTMVALRPLLALAAVAAVALLTAVVALGDALNGRRRRVVIAGREGRRGGDGGAEGEA
ncbi:MAG: hypothetical protein HY059_09590 [Proteobacteria bacterium]|nr:hypothetical protein [Pseudomonadota bacterium]